jgi:hypothetical protein
VFVSCGQLTEAERHLGSQVGEIVRAKSMTPFFADEVHSAGALNTVVFDTLRTCGAFVGILHQRGTVTFRPHRRSVRSSVWIQQEIAIFCYRMFVTQSVLPIRVYSQRGIRLEKA